MKKIFLIGVLFIFLSLTALFSQKAISFSFNDRGIDPVKFSQNITFSNHNYLYPAVNYSKTLTDTEAESLVKKIGTANMILTIFTMTAYASNAVVGAFILAEKFQDQSYLNGFFYSHIPLGVISGLLGATVISLGYVDISLRSKYHLFNNKANAVSIYINTGLAAAEVGFVVANLITSRLNPEAAKWIGLAHAITTGVFLVGITVQFGTSFIKK